MITQSQVDEDGVLSFRPGEPLDLHGISDVHGVTCVALSGTACTDSDLLQIVRAHPLVEELRLASTRVTDAGMEHLVGLTHLSELNLNYVKLTDGSLASLLQLSSLRLLSMQGTPISATGRDSIKQRIPEISISGFIPDPDTKR